MATRAQVYLVDASIWIFRAYFSLPDNWHAANGMPTNAVIGFAGSLAQLLERERPQRVLAAFDESLGSGFRHDIHPGYKKSRELPDAALAFQLAACRELARLLGIACLGSTRYEADDLIGSAARHARESGLACTVLSRDKDLGQVLAHAEDRLWDFPAGEPLDRAAWCERNGMQPEQVPELLALTGDAVDDVPGVPGIGRVTALSLLAEYADVEAILASTAAIAVSKRRGAARVAALLEQHRDTVRLARRLTGLDLEALAEPPDFARGAVDEPALEAFAIAHGLSSTLHQRLQRSGRPRA